MYIYYLTCIFFESLNEKEDSLCIALLSNQLGSKIVNIRDPFNLQNIPMTI